MSSMFLGGGRDDERGGEPRGSALGRVVDGDQLDPGDPVGQQFGMAGADPARTDQGDPQWPGAARASDVFVN